MSRLPFDFSKIKDADLKREVHLQKITELLEDNNLVRKAIPDGPNRLFKALSDTIYFTYHYYQQIQKLCIEYLRNLIEQDKLPSRLSVFQGNTMAWKDYSCNPCLPGFEKINLELVSLIFQKKIILYSITEDYYLTSTIINNKYDQTMQIIRVQGSQFDSIYNKKFMKSAGICQDIILNILEKALVETNQDEQMENKNNNNNMDVYINHAYEHSLKKEDSPFKEYKIQKGHHKKSLSDNFNVNFEQMEEQEIKFYNMLMGNNPSLDIPKLVGNSQQQLPTSSKHKDTDDSININSHLKFLEDATIETESKLNSDNLNQYMHHQHHAHTVKNINTENNTLSHTHDGSFSSFIRNIGLPFGKPPTKPQVFFNDALTANEIEKLDNIPLPELQVSTSYTEIVPNNGNNNNNNNNNDHIPLSPDYFTNTPPPGLTPTRYPNYIKDAYEDDQLYQSAPSIIGSNNQDIKQYQMMHPGSSHLSQSFHKTNPNTKRQMLSQSNMNITSNPNEYPYIHDYMGINMNMNTDQSQQQRMLFYNSNEKKKPIILDEGKQRYTGRLKFFDENKNYGFIIMDEDGSDIFVHYDDLQKANISKDILKTARLGCTIKLSFSCMKYIGKYDKSRKATDIFLLKVDN